MPDGYSNVWKNYKYLGYSFTFNSKNKVVIDTSLLLNIPILSKSDKVKIMNEYKKDEGDVNNVSEGFCYYILFLAINKDAWGMNKIFKMETELKLDGEIAEVGQDAINIYNTYNHLK